MTIPGVDITLCNLDGIHDVDSGDVWDGLSARDLERADLAAFAFGQEDQCLRAEDLSSNMLIARLIQFGVNIEGDVL